MFLWSLWADSSVSCIWVSLNWIKRRDECEDRLKACTWDLLYPVLKMEACWGWTFTVKDLCRKFVVAVVSDIYFICINLPSVRWYVKCLFLSCLSLSHLQTMTMTMLLSFLLHKNASKISPEPMLSSWAGDVVQSPPIHSQDTITTAARMSRVRFNPPLFSMKQTDEKNWHLTVEYNNILRFVIHVLSLYKPYCTQPPGGDGDALDLKSSIVIDLYS